MSSIAEKMAAATTAGRAERTVQICLRGDLVARLEDLERQGQEAKVASVAASKEDPGVSEVLDEIRELQEEMRDSTEVFRLRAMSPRTYRRLKEQHPPRRGDDGKLNAADANLGFNRDTFLHVLIRTSTVAPELTDRQWRELLGDSDTEATVLEEQGRDAEVVDGLLTYSQFVSLANTAYDLNEGDVSVPFSVIALLTSRSTDDE
jgi:hypothetical protein